LRPLQAAFERLQLPPGWYDGEAVVLNDAGVPDFGALQQAFDSQRSQAVVLYLFDLPYACGHDLRGVPLQARRAFLQGLLAAGGQRSDSDAIRFSEAFEATPESVLASACRMGLEGVIAKRRGSAYRSARSTDWVKLKCGQRQAFVIGGYTAPQGSRTGLGALLLGVHDAQGALQYVGDVGTGFSERALAALQATLESQVRSRSPFAAGTVIGGRPKWVAPTRIAEVSFAAWTRTGRLRHAVFRGLREDKDARAIVREQAQQVAHAQHAGQPSAQTSAHASSLPALPHVTNPQRVINALTGTTKLDLVRHYGQVGELMMQHLKGRPVSLLRAPEGVEGATFFQKHVEQHGAHGASEPLPGIRQLDPALDPDHPPMIEVARRQGLLSAAQWNVVEFHTMNAGAATFEHPDRMVFDLDPGAGVAWPQVQEAAQLVQGFLAQLGLPAFLKTSGGKGLHVVVPVKRLHDWDTVKGFSQAVVAHMAATLPQRFVVRSGPKNRVGKTFIDCLRNGRGATTVCAWSARARPGLGVSVPVGWDELATLRGGDHWTVQTVAERLAIGNGPWAGYARAARGLAAAMATLGVRA
jgi:bifunctional non-homologous end joining protein LigD